MQRTQVGLDTLLILLRKARIRVKRYEEYRDSGENTAADRLLPRMMELRNDLLTALKGAAAAAADEDRPTQEVVDETRHLLRVLAPGRDRRSREVLEDATIIIRKHRRRKAAEESDSGSGQVVERRVTAQRVFRPSETITIKIG